MGKAIEVYSRALDKSIEVERVIGRYIGKKPGPTLVFFGGIHGNEPSGVFALKQVFDDISEKQFNGNAYAVSGNLTALKKRRRYIDEDLNRIWTQYRVNALDVQESLNTEQEEQREIFSFIKRIISTHSGPFYFLDLHTTSSKSLPFITINDATINRRFSSLFPIPIILGIEEYLEGPLLSYLNELGYVCLGFESGQHEERESIDNHVSFIYLSMVFSGFLHKNEIPNFEEHFQRLINSSNRKRFTAEIIHLHRIKSNEKFKMKPGFKSFQHLKKGTVLASSNDEKIILQKTAMLFMPLYQSAGEDGYFLIRKINRFFLSLSIFLRKIEFDKLLPLFPGISWDDRRKEVLKVDLRVARFLAKPLFHLLGYRSRQIDQSHIKLYNRERSVNKNMYTDKPWYRGLSHRETDDELKNRNSMVKAA